MEEIENFEDDGHITDGMNMVDELIWWGYIDMEEDESKIGHM